jgi:hypothetical protein
VGWSKPLVSFFSGLAWVGLALSVWSHLDALVGHQGPLGDHEFWLHAGIFVVWFPAVMVSLRLTRDFKQKDYWKAALRGCPTWMKYMVYGFFGYAILNFAVFIASAPKGSSGPMTPSDVRGFSGHWMFFYSAAAATLYSGAHAHERDEGRRCLNGHMVSPLAKFCEECGQPVIERQ